MTWVKSFTQQDRDELHILLAKGNEKRAKWEFRFCDSETQRSMIN